MKLTISKTSKERLVKVKTRNEIDNIVKDALEQIKSKKQSANAFLIDIQNIPVSHVVKLPVQSKSNAGESRPKSYVFSSGIFQAFN